MKRKYLPGIAFFGALLMIVGWPQHSITMFVGGLGTIACAIAYDGRAVDALEARLAIPDDRHLPRTWLSGRIPIAEWQPIADAALASKARTLRTARATERNVLGDPIVFLTVRGPMNDRRIESLAAATRLSKAELKTLHRLAYYYGFHVRKSYEDYLRI